MYLCENWGQLHRRSGWSSWLWWCVALDFVIDHHCYSDWFSKHWTLIIHCQCHRWGPWLWKPRLQHLWVCSHSPGEQEVQEHSEESSTRAHILHHPLYADHGGSGLWEVWVCVLSLFFFIAFIFTLSSVSQIKVWTANPQQFVEDEDDDTFSYSVRISAQDLLLVRAQSFFLGVWLFSLLYL